ncbi:hypothetical protein IKU74_01985 [bacterium]|nr:hypothetical protein [bacterium]
MLISNDFLSFLTSLCHPERSEGAQLTEILQHFVLQNDRIRPNKSTSMD